MSKAYYYCKNFSFKEVNNIFAYAVKDPSTLTQHQRTTRLYKGVLRRLMANNIHCVKRVNFEKFHDEQYQVRRDFDKIYNNPNATTSCISHQPTITNAHAVTTTRIHVRFFRQCLPCMHIHYPYCEQIQAPSIILRRMLFKLKKSQRKSPSWRAQSCARFLQRPTTSTRRKIRVKRVSTYK